MHAAYAPIRARITLARVAFAAGCVSWCVACGAARQGTPIGMSDAAPEPAAAAAAKPLPAPSVAWSEFAAARAWPEAGPAYLALAHHRDGTRVHVLVEPGALAAYRVLAADAPMPDGARVVAWHETQAGALVDGYLLEKRDGVWAARVINAQGALVPDNTAPCLRCHDMAPSDHLFGLPEASPQPRESIDRTLR